MGEIASALIGKKVRISSIFGLLFTYLFFRQLGSWPEADPCQLIPLRPVVLPNPLCHGGRRGSAHAIQTAHVLCPLRG